LSSRTARRRHFHEDLDTLQARLMEMAGLVEKSIADASDAALSRDPNVAEVVRTTHQRIDALEVEIDERVIELLALQ